jgi:hypothetical protein
MKAGTLRQVFLIGTSTAAALQIYAIPEKICTVSVCNNV